MIDRRKSPEQMAKARARAKAWSAANAERKKAADVAYHAKNREMILARRKQRYLQSRDEHLAECRARYRADPEPYKARARKWLDGHREIVYARIRARKIKKRDSLKSALFQAQKGRCAYCRCRLVEVHIDHIMPRALGGTNDYSNLQLACGDCNFSKNARHPVEFARSKGLLL